MEEKELILDEVVTPIEETETKEASAIKRLSNKPKNNFKNNGFKTKVCKVIAYNKRTNTLDIKFDEYGIRIKNVKSFNGDVATVKYKGEIGKSNFEYKL